MPCACADCKKDKEAAAASFGTNKSMIRAQLPAERRVVSSRPSSRPLAACSPPCVILKHTAQFPAAPSAARSVLVIACFLGCLFSEKFCLLSTEKSSAACCARGSAFLEGSTWRQTHGNPRRIINIKEIHGGSAGIHGGSAEIRRRSAEIRRPPICGNSPPICGIRRRSAEIRRPPICGNLPPICGNSPPICGNSHEITGISADVPRCPAALL